MILWLSYTAWCYILLAVIAILSIIGCWQNWNADRATISSATDQAATADDLRKSA